MKKKSIAMGFVLAACLLLPARLAGQKATSLGQDLERLRKLHSTRAEVGRGLDLLLARDWEGAAREFARALEVLPENPNACYGMACIENRRGESALALAWIERAEAGCRLLQQAWENQKTNPLAISPEDAGRLREIAAQTIAGCTDLMNCVLNERSSEMKRTGVNTDPGSLKGNTDNSPFEVPAEFFALHGNLLFKLRRLEEAEAKYLEALALEPGHERCLNNLINLYFVARRFAPAREWLEAAAKRKVKINPRLKQAVLEAQ